MRPSSRHGFGTASGFWPHLLALGSKASSLHAAEDMPRRKARRVRRVSRSTRIHARTSVARGTLYRPIFRSRPERQIHTQRIWQSAIRITAERFARRLGGDGALLLVRRGRQSALPPPALLASRGERALAPGCLCCTTRVSICSAIRWCATTRDAMPFLLIGHRRVVCGNFLLKMI
jgi:hypothetical protein